MNENDLNHSYTPPALAQLNEQLLQVLSDNAEDWYSVFNDIIKQRDALIQAHLLSLDEAARKAFADAEYKVNEKLIDVARKLLDSAKDDMSHFVRSQAAIKKYK
ncbi:hypothetical protein [Alteromonas sp. CYL-A6]|uniref:hypothetical protein n=1 Tax=Alteromonas nitratireducens TaxID=3390813 RepID=UPI0034BBE213